MKVLNFKDYEDENFFIRSYYMDNNVTIKNIVPIVKSFEGENVKMVECYCNSFDGDGNVLHEYFSNIDDFKLLEKFPSPYISFSINFVDKITLDYKFRLLADTNSDEIVYECDKKKLKNNKSESSYVKR